MTDAPDPLGPHEADAKAQPEALRWMPLRKNLLAWLQQHTPSLADAYKGAVELLHQPGFPDRMHLIAHIVRDIANRLPEAFGGMKRQGRLDYTQKVQEIAEHWPLSGADVATLLRAAEPADEASPDVRIPRETYLQMSRLIAEHKARRSRPAARQLYEVFSQAGETETALLAPAIKRFSSLTSWFMGYAHLPAQPQVLPCESDLQAKFQQFERSLYGLVRHFFATLHELDAVLARPTPDKVDEAIALLVSPQHYRYFFDRLNAPQWIKPLVDAGMFANPPEPVQTESHGLVCLRWPQSGYLMRMASQEGELVCDILARIKTKNPYVIHDTVRASLAMPVELAARLAEVIATNLDGNTQPLSPQDIAQLIHQLADGGQAHSAMKLAQRLFRLPRPHDAGAGSGRIWRYQKCLETAVPSLVRATPQDVVQMLSGLLAQAVQTDRRSKEPADFSHLWWHNIGDPPRHDRDWRGLVGVALRDACQRVVRERIQPLAQVVRWLQGHRQVVFERLVLHLIRMFYEGNADVAREWILRQDLFFDATEYPEYALLLHDGFAALPTADRSVILSWVDAGPPNLATTIQSLAELFGRPLTASEVDGHVKEWKLHRLAWFHESLPQDWQKRYQDLVDEFGPPAPFDLPSLPEMPYGPTSPVTADELASWAVADIVRFLKTWRPDPKEPREQNPLALAGQLGAAIARDPGRFAKEARSFADTNPIYVRTLLEAAEAAIRREVPIELGPVLDLCDSALQHPLTGVTGDGLSDDRRYGDPSWQFARDAICNMVNTLCGQETPIQWRTRLWQVLEPLTHDTTQSYSEESENGDPRCQHCADLSINTPRGRALHAVVRYTLWVRSHLPTPLEGAEPGPFTLGSMPEVRQVLDQHLDQDDSPAVRAVYGWWFPWLHLLDKDWAAQRRNDIFPLSGPQKRLCWAVLNTFLVANDRVSEEVFALLREQYQHAVDILRQITCDSDNLGRHDSPQGALAVHLLVLYGRGALGLERGSLIERFFTNAPPPLATYALEFVGELLNSEGELPGGILAQFRSLWEWLQPRLAAGDQGAVAAQAAFGAWFSSGRFDESWGLDALAKALAGSAQVSESAKVMAKLAKSSTTFPSVCVLCAETMARGDRDGWNINDWQEDLRTVLRNALAAPDEYANEAARRLIDHLGRRGFYDFGLLLAE